MMQSIATKFVGPTNTKGARISAKSANGHWRLTVSWDHGLGIEQNHTKAAMQLAEKAGWNGHYHGGSTETGYVFVIECDTGRGQFSVVKGKGEVGK